MQRSPRGRIKTTDKKIKNPDVQRWFLNMAIFCLSIVIIGFIFSMGKRVVLNKSKISLSQSVTVPLSEKPYSYIVVEVLNGCGTPGLAQKFTNYLRQQGFIDVIYTGNADKMDYERTHLIERANVPEKSKEVLNLLMFDSSRIVSKEDPSLHVDLTLILGKDYKDLPVYLKILDIGENL
ncbi:MAG: hypothetical protein DRP89_03000 [Candidatus Neomarinimicrobiota bacterium]|nr:MAG: hypothetical protein DRP89_03000 [Candidatus Neomarinimicrobiota bacterium]